MFGGGHAVVYTGVSSVMSHIQLFAAPWTIDYQAPLCMEFSTQEHWSELPFPTPEDLLNPEI